MSYSLAKIRSLREAVRAYRIVRQPATTRTRATHIALNVKLRRLGVEAPACDGPDCDICALLSSGVRRGELRVPLQKKMHWSVTLERGGEHVVSIESTFLSGRDLSLDDEEAIRTAAQHLLALVGAEPLPPSR